MGRACIFCFKDEGRTDPWVPNNPGGGCTYGLGHEYPCPVCGNLLCKLHVAGQDVKPPPQMKKPSKNLCTKCGLHPNNPTSKTNGCEHEYPGFACQFTSDRELE